MKTVKNQYKRLKIVGLALVLAATSFISFGFIDNYFEVSKNLDIMATMYKEVNTYYVDEIDANKLMRTGIEAMLASLDPYTNYISESEIEDYRFMTTGQYGGIGARITSSEGYILITDVYKGFPADKAGIKVGDLIKEADGKDTKDKNSSEVSDILKGTPGTSVNVMVKRPGKEELEKVEIVREKISVKNVPYVGFAEEGIGYITLRSFTQNAGNEVRDAVNELKKQDPNLKGVILDVRGNPGGLLHEAVNICNVFIPKGEIVVNTKGKAKEWDKTYKTINNPVDTEIPVVVLTSSTSASASEIVSGVIQDYDRGVIIGQRTFGKGLVQTTRPLSYNAKLKVTTAKYYIPSGRCIQALDYSHRNEDGSVGKIPDSLMEEFATANGRKVYDGGGVNPDVEIDRDNLSNIAYILLSKRHIFNYATQFVLENEEISEAKEFNISDPQYQEFVDYLSDKDYDYTTKSEKQLEKYKEQAEKEKYFDAISEEYAQLEKKMLHDKKQDLTVYKEQIVELLEEEIASRYYYEEGKIEASFDADKDIIEAIVVLSNKNKYNELLK
jgi:carboxyl-terminal processing protease